MLFLLQDMILCQLILDYPSFKAFLHLVVCVAVNVKTAAEGVCVCSLVGKAAVVGHSWTGALQEPHSELHPGLYGGCGCL